MEKRFALITGASGGIGRAIALKLAEDHYSLYLHYNQNEKSITELMSELERFDIEVIPIQADLGKPDGYKQIAAQIFSLHAVVLNSGNSFYGLMSDTNDQIVQQMTQLHVASPFQLTRELLPKLMSANNASIVAVTSIWGQAGAACEVFYSMVKGSQNAFVKALSKECALNDIRVNGIAPGAISTAMLEGFTEEEFDQLNDDIPMGRVGKPIEIAETAAFLLSSKASYITGQIVGVNGGWY